MARWQMDEWLRLNQQLRYDNLLRPLRRSLCAAASVPQLTIVIGCRSLVVILPISCLYTISFAHFTAL